jgi:lipoprotein-anchoring transpeptidase ErfK/SrfK
MGFVFRRVPQLGLAVLAALAAGEAGARERVAIDIAAPPGDIVISQSRRMLYLALGDGTALAYRVAVGRAGKSWIGTKPIVAKFREIAWAPPASVKRDMPWLPDMIPAGDPSNPMGARVISLPGEYAIHGTNAKMRRSIGTAASYGCIRMLNEDIVDLFERVRVGARVTVVR